MPPPEYDEELEEGEGSQEEVIPDNFVKDLATRLVVLFEKEVDPKAAAVSVSKFIFESTNTVKKMPYFIDVLEMLLDNQQTQRFAALSWVALVNESVNVKAYDGYVQDMCDYLLESFYQVERNDVDLKGKKFSGTTGVIAENFIKMFDMNKNFGDVCSELYTILIRKEMEIEALEESEEEQRSGRSGKKKGKKSGGRTRLYDEIIDYLSTKTNMKTNTMSSENPFEFLGVLLEKLRATKRYVVQELVNQRASEKKKKLELELQNRMASAEEIVMANDQFADGLSFFVKERKYNFKFLAVERVRLTLQLVGSILGALYFIAGYMDMYGIDWVDGTIVSIVMLFFSRMVTSRRRFSDFYPYDVSKELETCSTGFINVFRHMSQEQLDNFLTRQIRNDRNQSYLKMLPEYMKYIYAIMPDRKNMLMSVPELSAIVESIEIEVSKRLRGMG
jgi:hypothetical protein